MFSYLTCYLETSYNVLLLHVYTGRFNEVNNMYTEVSLLTIAQAIRGI
jgi:hypothetical protein